MANENVNWEMEVDNVKTTEDVIRLILALLSGVKLLTAALGYHMFTDELYVAIANIIPTIIILWVAWKNNYVTKVGKAQKLVLAKHNLIDKQPHEIIKSNNNDSI